MVVSYFVRHFIVAVFPQAVDDHIVGARPDSALPITSEWIVFPVVGREGRHPVRAVELRRISEMRHHPVESFFRKDICLKCPESAHALGWAEASVIVLVIEEPGFFIPQIVIDISAEEFHFIFEVLDFLPSFDIETYLEKALVHKNLL